MSESKKYTFPGEKIDVQWDGKLCIHIAECGNSEGDLFIGGRKPWCQPDLVEDDEVAEVVERCPTGALTYTNKTGDNEVAATVNSVQVVYNGPLFISGDLAIEDVSDDLSGVQYRAALCRCGQSKNKPFCDNSHVAAKFEDFGAVGKSSPALEQNGGKLEIKCASDGPLLLKGNMRIIASSGRVAWQGTQTALCRCGASKNKPFCDGSHNDINFKS